MTDIIKYEDVVFIQDRDEYEEFAKIMYPEYDGLSTGLERDFDSALEYLTKWDYGEETDHDPVYDKYEAIGIHDNEYETDDYLMNWHHGLSYAGLYRKTLVATEHQFLSFVHGYVNSMLWANTTHESIEDYDAYHDGVRLDNDSETYEELKDDCIDFIRQNFETLKRVAEKHFNDMNDWGQHGHDFALTRNHHGAGFWDRGYGKDGDLLTNESHPYGDRSLYVSNDGEVLIEQ